jgi:hypothetical protein
MPSPPTAFTTSNFMRIDLLPLEFAPALTLPAYEKKNILWRGWMTPVPAKNGIVLSHHLNQTKSYLWWYYFSAVIYNWHQSAVGCALAPLLYTLSIHLSPSSKQKNFIQKSPSY